MPNKIIFEKNKKGDEFFDIKAIEIISQTEANLYALNSKIALTMVDNLNYLVSRSRLDGGLHRQNFALTSVSNELKATNKIQAKGDLFQLNEILKKGYMSNQTGDEFEFEIKNFGIEEKQQDSPRKMG